MPRKQFPLSATVRIVDWLKIASDVPELLLTTPCRGIERGISWLAGRHRLINRIAHLAGGDYFALLVEVDFTFASFGLFRGRSVIPF